MSIKNRIITAYARTKLNSRRVSEDVENPLQDLVQLKVRDLFKHDADFRKALGRRKLGEIDRDTFEQYQLYMFRKQMAYVMENSPYYQKRYAEVGVRPEDIRTMDDLDKVPLTEPEDLAEEPFLFLCQSQSKIARTFSTSGTTGKPKTPVLHQRGPAEHSGLHCRRPALGRAEEQRDAAHHVPGRGGLGPQPHAAERLQGGRSQVRGLFLGGRR